MFTDRSLLTTFCVLCTSQMIFLYCLRPLLRFVKFPCDGSFLLRIACCVWNAQDQSRRREEEPFETKTKLSNAKQKQSCLTPGLNGRSGLEREEQ